MPVEGQYLESVKDIMRVRPWDPEYRIPWETIKSKWEAEWDLSKPILVEKSPPNLIRAFEIEKAFSPSYFIIIIRDPYAFCQGYIQRQKVSIEEPAKLWVNWAQYQVRNIEGLERTLFFTYESFTEDPIGTSNKILRFFPQLEYLNPDASFLARSILGYESRKISNLNHLKIGQLSVRDIMKINSVLENHPDLLQFFGYQMLHPALWDELGHYQSVMQLRIIQFFARAKRIGKRIFSG
jgi:hypothetical protein